MRWRSGHVGAVTVLRLPCHFLASLALLLLETAQRKRVKIPYAHNPVSRVFRLSRSVLDRPEEVPDEQRREERLRERVCAK